MEKFNYKRLDGFILPNADYFRALQSHALSLERELETMRQERSKDGNHYFQSEAKQDKTENRGLYKQIGQLEGKLAAIEGKHVGELERLKGHYEGKIAEQETKHRAELEELKKQIAILKETQVIEVTREEPVKVDYRTVDRARGSNGRLLPTGSSREERKNRVYDLIKNHNYTPEMVADTMGNLSIASVKTYYSERKKEEKRANEKADAEERERLLEKKRNEFTYNQHGTTYSYT